MGSRQIKYKGGKIPRGIPRVVVVRASCVLKNRFQRGGRSTGRSVRGVDGG